MKKRILSLALALVMCLGLSVPALAEHAASDVAYPVTGGNIYFDPATGTITDSDKSITAADIPAQINGAAVTSIGVSAFATCNNLTTVTIPVGVTSIGLWAFRACGSLTTVTIPKGVEILDGAFAGCTSLTSVTIPEDATGVGSETFTNCASLTTVTIPNGVTYIGPYAFTNCTSLTSVTIPASVTQIGDYAFGECGKLTDVYYGGSQDQWKAISLWLFYEGDGSATDLAGVGLDKVTIHYNSTGPAAQPLAYASTQNVLVDGKPVEFQCYALKDEKGNDTNYVKVRDLAYVLNGTAAQFNVGWDGSVNLEKGKAYASNGSEMNTPFSGNRAYQASAAQTKVDGAAVKLESIVLNDDNGGGYTYYKLRDLGAALGFKVDWSAEKGVYIETK